MSNINAIKSLTNQFQKNPTNTNIKGKLNIALAPLKIKKNTISPEEKSVLNAANAAIKAALSQDQGNAVVPQGNAVVPQGNAVVPQGNAVVPQGNAVVPQGNAVVPQGNVKSNVRPNAKNANCNGISANVTAKGLQYKVCVGKGTPVTQGGRRTRHKKQRTLRNKQTRSKQSKQSKRSKRSKRNTRNKRK